MAGPEPRQSSEASLAISPAVIVGIVIAGAFVVVLISASLFRYCRTNQTATLDTEVDELGGDIFNPNRPRPESQATRMREVRWINNMYAWERGRYAKMETGELRPITMLLGRSGQSRNWDEWSDSHSERNSVADCTGAAYFYTVDDPYAPSSQQRLGHLVPPTSARNSYRPNSQYNNPRHHSVLLPQPVHRDLLGSPLRREQPRERRREDQAAEAEEWAENTRKSPSHPPNHPQITINDGTEDIGRLHGGNFETIALVDGHEDIQGASGSGGPSQRRHARPHSPGSVGLFDGGGDTGDASPKDHGAGGEGDEQEESEHVKGMIQQWEHVNGRFARAY